MSLSIAIMHVPTDAARAANVVRLLEQLPDAVVVNDRGLGLWDTARRAWSQHAEDATHHLVLQDDAVLCEGFRVRVKALLGGPISLFKSSVGRYRRVPSAVAVMLPVELVRAWLESVGDQPVKHDNVALHDWMQPHGISMRYTTPSLVEHGPFRSLLGHGVVRADAFVGAA